MRVTGTTLWPAASWRSSVLSFHYSTTSRTLIRASQRREQLGEDFDRMLCLAVQWAGQRPALGLAQRLRIDTDAEDDHTGKEALIEEFVERRLPIELPDILELSAQAEREIEAIRCAPNPRIGAHCVAASAARADPAVKSKPFIAGGSASTLAFFRRHSPGWTSRRRGQMKGPSGSVSFALFSTSRSV